MPRSFLSVETLTIIFITNHPYTYTLISHREKGLNHKSKNFAYQTPHFNKPNITFSFSHDTVSPKKNKCRSIDKQREHLWIEKEQNWEENTCEFRSLSLKHGSFCPEDWAAARSLCVVLFKKRVAFLQMQLWPQMKFTLNEPQIHSP